MRPRRALAWPLLLLAAPGCLGRALHLGVEDDGAAAALRAEPIAYARRNDLWLARGDGQGSALLLRGDQIGPGGAIFLPTLCPRGERVAFLTLAGLEVRDATGMDLSLHIISLAASRGSLGRIRDWRQIRLEKLVAAGASGRHESQAIAGLAWSRDGSRLALGVRRGPSAAGDTLVLFDREGAPQATVPLPGRRLAPAGTLSWEPSGGGIVVGLESEAPEGQTAGLVARVGLPGAGGPGPIADLGPGRHPALSPDGTRIAAVDDRAGTWDIILTDPAGREVNRFVRPAGRAPGRLRWSAEGRFIYYESLASVGPLGLLEITILRCLDTRTRRVFDLARLS